MPVEQARVRLNYLAVLVAAIVCFLLEAAWYSYFAQPWLAGVGRTREWLVSQGVNPALQYGTAFFAAMLAAIAISCFIQLTGAQTALRGIKVAALLWFGFVFTTWATEYAFEVRTYTLFAINTGFWLIGMAVMGALVGAWKRE